MKRKSSIEPPDVGKSLYRIAGVGKDCIIEEIQSSSQCFFQYASWQGAAVSRLVVVHFRKHRLQALEIF